MIKVVLLVAIFAPITAAQTTVYSSSAQPDSGYVGSSACSSCHQQIFESYSHTDMGRSMWVPSSALLKTITLPVMVNDPHSHRQFEISTHDGQLFQSEYQRIDNKDILRETHKIEWIIGAGANGSGAIVKRDDFLFEAPLSFYAKTKTWELSPGYEFVNYGFSRPILPGCISCHSGRPQAVSDGNGRFREPAFTELAIGCENCHGPGQAHVSEMLLSEPTGAGSASIVNPAKLTPWLANNICMACHQTGDGRVLQPGKEYRDFRPGRELNETLAIFVVPPSRNNPLQSDLLEHYFAMTLSKCYRRSAGRLACTTCHDPHVQPSAAEASAYFRSKCLSCHSEKSCAVPLALRQRKTPPDDCAGCHMPKRDIGVISHSALTNHRIVAETGEAFPEVSATKGTPGLTYLNAAQGEEASVSPLVLLEGYGQAMTSHPEYRAKYWELARQLEKSHPGNVIVLKALADWATQQKSPEASDKAVEYLNSAIQHGDSDPTDYEALARLLLAKQRTSEAIKLLQTALQAMPYDAEYYRLIGKASLGKQNADVREILRKGASIFPQDSEIRELLKRNEEAAAASN